MEYTAIKYSEEMALKIWIRAMLIMSFWIVMSGLFFVSEYTVQDIGIFLY